VACGEGPLQTQAERRRRVTFAGAAVQVGAGPWPVQAHRNIPLVLDQKDHRYQQRDQQNDDHHQQQRHVLLQLSHSRFRRLDGGSWGFAGMGGAAGAYIPGGGKPRQRRARPRHGEHNWPDRPGPAAECRFWAAAWRPIPAWQAEAARREADSPALGPEKARWPAGEPAPGGEFPRRHEFRRAGPVRAFWRHRECA